MSVNLRIVHGTYLCSTGIRSHSEQIKPADSISLKPIRVDGNSAYSFLWQRLQITSSGVSIPAALAFSNVLSIPILGDDDIYFWVAPISFPSY
jgi:hypothetical protein